MSLQVTSVQSIQKHIMLFTWPATIQLPPLATKLALHSTATEGHRWLLSVHFIYSADRQHCTTLGYVFSM